VGTDVGFAFSERAVHSRRVPICDNKIRNISNDDSAGSYHGMTANGNSVRYACADSYS
jgi:hypothetical protein